MQDCHRLPTWIASCNTQSQICVQDKRVIGSVSEAVQDATKHRQHEDSGVPDPAAHEPRGVPRRAALGSQRAEQVSLNFDFRDFQEALQGDTSRQ